MVAPTGQYLRGWSADSTDILPDDPFNTSKIESGIHFDFTLPEDFTDGEGILFRVDAGRFTDTVMPAAEDITQFMYCLVIQKDGGPAFTGPYTGSGLSFPVGTVNRTWPSDTEYLGEGWPEEPIGFFVIHDNTWGFTSEDASPTYTGESMIPTPFAPDPYGAWRIAAAKTSGFTPIDLAGGQTYSCYIAAATYIDTPDTSAYVAIRSIQILNQAEDTVLVDIPLAETRIGWGAGAATVPWGTGLTTDDGAPYNAEAVVPTSQPPQAAPSQDMWLVSGSAAPSNNRVSVSVRIGKR